jgi:hypothetical protein
MPISGLIAAALAGLLGGAHCLAMCGGFVAALGGARAPAGLVSVPLRPAQVIAWRELPYNLGRVATYCVLGAIAGGSGGALLAAGDWWVLQRTLYVIANIFLLVLALSIVSNGKGAVVLQRLGGRVFARVIPAVRPLRARDSALARFALGGVWGLVPCGLVYGVLPIALFSGGAAQGGAIMLAFGLGTLPNLLAAGFIVGRARRWFSARGARYAAASLLAGFALVGIGRALFGPLAAAHGAFCF